MFSFLWPAVQNQKIASLLLYITQTHECLALLLENQLETISHPTYLQKILMSLLTKLISCASDEENHRVCFILCFHCRYFHGFLFFSVYEAPSTSVCTHHLRYQSSSKRNFYRISQLSPKRGWTSVTSVTPLLPLGCCGCSVSKGLWFTQHQHLRSCASLMSEWQLGLKNTHVLPVRVPGVIW